MVAGELSPVFRVAAFYGRAGDVVPGTRVVTHLAGPWAEPAELLGPWAGELPTYPSLAAGPDGTSGSLYLDTSSLAPEAAWEVARAVGKAAGAAVPPPTTLPPLLGVSVARDPGSERLLFDVYSRWRPGAPGPWLPPASVLRTAGPGALVATLRQDAGGALVTRKWDVPWWSTGRSDQELADVLGVRGAGADALRDLLDSERYTLHPTTLALRPGGRRIYARLR